ncbi:hypothetical protein Trydic_g5915 [Trypoxylus dichotomus]
MCFEDFSKAFDHVLRNDVLKILVSSLTLTLQLQSNYLMELENQSNKHWYTELSELCPVLTNSTETRVDTKKTKQKVLSVEMKILRKIANITLRDRWMSKSIRERCGIQDVATWSKRRRKEWDDQVERMQTNKHDRPRGKDDQSRDGEQSWFSSSPE